MVWHSAKAHLPCAISTMGFATQPHLRTTTASLGTQWPSVLQAATGQKLEVLCNVTLHATCPFPEAAASHAQIVQRVGA